MIHIPGTRTHTYLLPYLGYLFMLHRQYLSIMAFLWINFRLPCRPPVYNNNNNNKTNVNCALNIFEHVSTLAPLVVVAVLVNVEASDSSAEAALLLFLRLHLPLSLYQLFAPCIFGTVTVTLSHRRQHRCQRRRRQQRIVSGFSFRFRLRFQSWSKCCSGKQHSTAQHSGPVANVIGIWNFGISKFGIGVSFAVVVAVAVAVGVFSDNESEHPSGGNSFCAALCVLRCCYSGYRCVVLCPSCILPHLLLLLLLLRHTQNCQN